MTQQQAEYNIKQDAEEAIEMLGKGYVVEAQRLPLTIHKIENTCEVPHNLYYVIPLDCLQEALLFTGEEAYLMQSKIVDQWYLFVPFTEDPHQ